MLLGLLEQRDAQLVLGEDALVDQDLAEVALGGRRRGLVHPAMIRVDFNRRCQTLSTA
jgi:hypothetical protein